LTSLDFQWSLTSTGGKSSSSSSDGMGKTFNNARSRNLLATSSWAGQSVATEDKPQVVRLSTPIKVHPNANAIRNL
jgi:hypothetical protein